MTYAALRGTRTEAFSALFAGGRQELAASEMLVAKTYCPEGKMHCRVPSQSFARGHAWEGKNEK